MKNQYFGDARDYFKYDLLDQLASGISDIEILTCLWMLTPPDGTGQGHVRFIPDDQLPELTEFFRERLDPRDEARCRVSEMAGYFGRRPYRFYQYREDRDDFNHWSRDEYFVSVPDEVLSRAVVFFDPDTGMEPKKCKSAHLRYSELKAVLDRMDVASVAVVFQYQRRIRDWTEVIRDQLRSRVSPYVAFIHEGPLAFYCLAKTADRSADVRRILGRVAAIQTPFGRGARRLG